MIGYSPGWKMEFRAMYRILLAFDVLVDDVRHKKHFVVISMTKKRGKGYARNPGIFNLKTG